MPRVKMGLNVKKDTLSAPSARQTFSIISIRSKWSTSFEENKKTLESITSCIPLHEIEI